ncbi:MAG: hypothetical protein M3Q27_07600, partial [Actinomycetota bacterium]|nr:hypothetical protein [Actinomycetota bacterium]
MRFYADSPARRSRQLAADVGIVVWTVSWVWLGVTLHRLVSWLAAPGRELQRAGSDFSEGLAGAARRAGELPLVGDALRESLARAGGAGTVLADAGRAQQETVERLALLLALLVAGLPIAYLVGRWLPRRLRWARDAQAARTLASTPDGLELLAVRA